MWGEPSLVGVATPHRIGSRRRVHVSWCLGAARCTGVMFADTVAMRPTVVTRFRFVDRLW
jgi:hypothetical protein